MMGPVYMSLNRGKRSVALDLKAEADLAVMHALLKDADVFIHNVRASAISRLGLDYDAVKAINPQIIYLHCVGFGSDGPYGGLQAYDDVIQTASGMTSMQSMVDGDPRPRYVPSAIADKVAGLHAATPCWPPTSTGSGPARASSSRSRCSRPSCTSCSRSTCSA